MFRPRGILYTRHTIPVARSHMLGQGQLDQDAVHVRPCVELSNAGKKRLFGNEKGGVGRVQMGAPRKSISRTRSDAIVLRRKRGGPS